MNSIETPKKELTPEEIQIEKEKRISVKIEKKVMEKYAPLLMLKNKQMTLEEARSEWIKEYALSFRNIFNSDKNKILELYDSGNGLEESADYMEKELEGGC